MAIVHEIRTKSANYFDALIDTVKGNAKFVYKQILSAYDASPLFYL